MVIYRIDEIPFAFPTAQIIAFFIVAIIAGILAAILPARRASRLDVLRHCSTLHGPPPPPPPPPPPHAAPLCASRS